MGGACGGCGASSQQGGESVGQWQATLDSLWPPHAAYPPQFPWLRGVVTRGQIQQFIRRHANDLPAAPAAGANEWEVVDRLGELAHRVSLDGRGVILTLGGRDAPCRTGGSDDDKGASGCTSKQCLVVAREQCSKYGDEGVYSHEVNAEGECEFLCMVHLDQDVTRTGTKSCAGMD